MLNLTYEALQPMHNSSAQLCTLNCCCDACYAVRPACSRRYYLPDVRSTLADCCCVQVVPGVSALVHALRSVITLSISIIPKVLRLRLMMADVDLTNPACLLPTISKSLLLCTGGWSGQTGLETTATHLHCLSSARSHQQQHHPSYTPTCCCCPALSPITILDACIPTHAAANSPCCSTRTCPWAGSQ